MRFVVPLYLTLGLLVLAIGHRKWWRETDMIVSLMVESYVEDWRAQPSRRWRAYMWIVAVIGSICFDMSLWPRAAWRWWIR